MIDEQNYEQWAMDYIEGTLDASTRQEFDTFLASHPAIAAQITSLQKAMPVLPPSNEVYPDKQKLLRGREIRLARLQDRLQRFGAMMSGAAAAAVLFGGLFLFNPDRANKGADQMAAEATAAYPEGAEALADRMAEEAAQGNEASTTLSPSALHDEMATRTPAIQPNTLNLPVSVPQTIQSQQTTKHSSISPNHSTVPAKHPSLARQAQPNAGQTQILNSLSSPAQLLQVSSPALNTAQITIQPAQQKEPHSIIAQRIASNRNASSTEDRSTSEAEELKASVESSIETLISTINDVSPISRYRTNKESGITIASFIHIGKEIDSDD